MIDGDTVSHGDTGTAKGGVDNVRSFFFDRSFSIVRFQLFVFDCSFSIVRVHALIVLREIEIGTETGQTNSRPNKAGYTAIQSWMVLQEQMDRPTDGLSD